MIDDILKQIRELDSTLFDPQAALSLLRIFVEAMPDAILIVESGNIVMVNHQTELMFGYLRQELQDMPVEILLPERLRDRHIQHRVAFELSPRVRAMGVGLLLLARRKNGTEFGVDINLSPAVSRWGEFVIASVRKTNRHGSELT